MCKDLIWCSTIAVHDDLPIDTPFATAHLKLSKGDKSAERAMLDKMMQMIRLFRDREMDVCLRCDDGEISSPRAGAFYLSRLKRISIEEAYRELRFGVL